MVHETSVMRNLKTQKRFIPPFCPNKLCSFHHTKDLPSSQWWRNHGWNELKNFPHWMRRFRCSKCQKTFTFSFFKLEFWEQFRRLNESIFTMHTSGLSNREIGRQINHSESLVRKRLSKMTRWAYLEDTYRQRDLVIKEPIAYDGLENFSHSQFAPNNINQAIGKESYFIYDFNFAPINRKGRMSDRQKEKKKDLELEHNCYPKNILRTTTTTLLSRLIERCQDKVLILHSDEHFQYRRSVKWDLRHHKIVHETISSKAHRNFQNPLFAVNNADLMIRHRSAAFKRETIAFSKHSIAMVEKYQLFRIHKNYMRPIFYKKQKRDLRAHLDSPAVRLGIAEKILNFREFFKQRRTLSQVPLHSDWLQFFLKIDTLSRRKILSNNRIYA